MEFLILVGSVALLMYGMKVMSEGLQKMAGSRLRTILGTMTTNRFTGLLTGAFITTSIQSSTATTVMTVSFVSGSALAPTGYFCHHGRQYRHHRYSLDYGAGRQF